MILVRCIRQFHADTATVTLAQDFAFTAAPTIGSRIDIAGEARPLSVVSITYRPQPNGTGALPVGVELYLECEDLTAADAARDRGWQPVEQAD